uniref:Blue (Type 1) copper domain n=1 Tax=Medicago truncatula TaxID=3880 RepID=Q2HWC3_MEDTR|nr:Blue (type 1) copper domain [Medicago truncatula]
MKGIKLLVSMSQAMMILLLVCTVLVMLPVASAKRWIVGDKKGWTTNINYSTWIEGNNFYNGDWLFFSYDRNQMNVLEVNKTDYETCNSDHPIYNWAAGAGRDVVPLNVTRDYYLISGKGFCFGGMKLAIHVKNYPPPPVARATFSYFLSC